jgi:alpha,alpha-trehalase
VHARCSPHASLAGFYPLWAGLATRAQAARLVQDWLPKFDCPGGLVTTLEERAGRQWAYPNGWAPLHWLVAAGLERYGYTDEARKVRTKWLDHCARIFAATGAMWEAYNVVDLDVLPEAGPREASLYGSLAGFGWSNAVFVDFARRLDEQPVASNR